MQQPADQKLLLRDLSARIHAVGDAQALTRVMAEILSSLLRRKGDGEFLSMIQDAFIAGIANRSFEEQRGIALEIVRVVIDKRPEIALAWQALHNPQPAPALRRAADLLTEENTAPPPDPQAEPRPAPVFYEFARAEILVGHYVADVLDRRLQLFQAAEPRFPSATYRQGREFFLFDPAFAGVLRRFFTDVVMEQCRDALQRKLYREIRPATLNDDRALAEFLAEKRPETWKILLERLTKMGAHHRAAEAKLAGAEAKLAAGHTSEAADFAEVDVPVTRPRTFQVLGVNFTLGQRTTTRRMRVRIKASTEPNADEMEALTLITRLRNMAADAGLELPAGCDFLFLRTLLEFDARKYAALRKELLALADHPETSRKFLLDRLKQVDETFANTLSDALVLMMFAQSGDGNFGFKEMYDECMGSVAAHDAVQIMRPFLLGEIGRRPRDLAFQVRDVLKRGYDEATLEQALRILLDAWQVMSRSRFRAELDAALTVFASFPVAFAGDADEPAFSHIGHLLQRALTAETIEADPVVETVNAIYAPVIQRIRNQVKTTTQG